MAANSHSLDLEAGSLQYASIADASQTGLDLSGDFTLEAWVNFESLPSDANFEIISKLQTGDTAYRLFLEDASGVKNLVIVINETADDTTRDVVKLAWTPVIGHWYHIAVSCTVANATATTFLFYINGISQGNGTAAVSGNCSSINNSAGDFVIGAFNEGASAFFDGLIDEVRVWSDVRTAAEIHDHIFNDVAGQSNLVGYWKLNNSYLDETANNNDLTASGSPVFSTTVPFPDYRIVNSVALSQTTLAVDANLQGYWTLDDVLTDGSGNGNTLTNNNAATFNTGKFNNGIDLEASSSQYLSIADASQTGLDILGDLTFSCWFNPESNGANYFLIDKLDGDAGYRLEIQADNTLRVAYRSSSANPAGVALIATASAQITVTGQLYHIAAAVDVSARTCAFYLNGILLASAATSGDATSIANSTKAFGIGGDGSTFCDGIIDDAAIFDRILTADEVFDLYTGADIVTTTSTSSSTTTTSTSTSTTSTSSSTSTTTSTSTTSTSSSTSTSTTVSVTTSTSTTSTSTTSTSSSTTTSTSTSTSTSTTLTLPYHFAIDDGGETNDMRFILDHGDN